ncbi:hypothetical protein [Falsirhodobacter sp. 20TX0035]|uniref:hypothetical protein n=1 Tax=Falsirhodobacter sp. 20TX0035 TaxID=3022019 RepID=UPI00232DAB19|nr:hypothetical protein [Falsirhodobacter sp. 20TX0035]MDB6454719.1 hypothetical protein [Falsirhodobacter sp. 20TX0035]
MMAQCDEWGPWIEHKGDACPVPIGTVIHFHWKFRDDEEGDHVGRVSEFLANSSIWKATDAFKFRRYRIRKPRALQQLIDMVENLLAPIREREDA